MSYSIFIMASMFAFFVVSVSSLICYENIGEIEIIERHNTSWTYCAFVPPMGDEKTGRVFGLSSASDSTENYDVAFSKNDNLYSILSMCILEKYDFGRITGDKLQAPEFLFRCVCNYDRCNSATTFDRYLSALKIDAA